MNRASLYARGNEIYCIWEGESANPRGCGGVKLTLLFRAALHSDGSITSGARFKDSALCLVCTSQAWWDSLQRDVLCQVMARQHAVCLSVFIKRLHAKCGYMDYFSCLLSPERCPPHFDKKCLPFRWPSSAAQDLTNIWTISHKNFLVKDGGFFFLPQTKQLFIWPQSKQNLSYYCIKLWGTTYSMSSSSSFPLFSLMYLSYL